MVAGIRANLLFWVKGQIICPSRLPGKKWLLDAHECAEAALDSNGALQCAMEGRPILATSRSLLGQREMDRLDRSESPIGPSCVATVPGIAASPEIGKRSHRNVVASAVCNVCRRIPTTSARLRIAG